MSLSGFNFYRQTSGVDNDDNLVKWNPNNEQQGYSNVDDNIYSRVDSDNIEIDLIANPQWNPTTGSNKPVFVSSRLITIDENENLKIIPNSQLTVTFSAILPIPKNIDGSKIDNFPIWPALWIMGRNIVGDVGLTDVGDEKNLVRWPKCSEIDVMEWNGRSNQYSAAVHFFDDDIQGHRYITGGSKQVSDGNSHDYKVVIINSTPGNISPERSIQFFFDNEPLNYPIDLTDSKYDDFFKDHRNEATLNTGNKYYSLLMNIAYGGDFVDGASLAEKSSHHGAFTDDGATARMTISNIVTNLEVNIDNFTHGEPYTVSDGPVMTGNFDGTYVENDIYTFPTDALNHAGFANVNRPLTSMVVGDNARIIFEARVPSGGEAVVRFKFEANPYPNNEPSYDTPVITVSGDTETTYIINLDQQVDQTFNSFLMYLNTRDVEVEIKNIRLDKITVASGGDDAVELSAPLLLMMV